MQPLAALDLTTLRDVPGIALDVDDTLTRDGMLEPEALEALYRLRSLGVPAVLVTGRPIGWVEALAALLPVALAVGENGAGWAWIRSDGQRVLERGRYIDADLSPRRSALVAKVASALPDVRLAADHPLRMCDVAFDVGESVKISAVRVAQLRSLVEGEGARVVVSSVHLHASFGDWDKASGVARAAGRVLGVAADELFSRWIFVGDSGNDAPAFARFARTVAVANVKEHLGALAVPPRFVTEADRGRGVRELVDRLALARHA